MEPALIIVAVLIFLPLLWFIGNYNGLIRLRNHCDESWSGIDTELKRRHDLIPNLVECVKGYAAHERSVLESVIKARTRAVREHGTPAEMARDENQLISSLGGLFAVAEGYPDLKADRQFLHLQHELVNTENRIQAARRFYNANVRDFNNRIEMFPSSIIAGMFSFKQRDFFEVDNLAERVAPQVSV